jgi:hypothetical protein
MGYFYNDFLACVISHPEVMTEIGVFAMRSAIWFSGQLNERVAFMPSCASCPAFRIRLPDHSPARYDVSGVPAERIQDIIETDWNHLLREKRVLNSPNYLREDGKPVISIWGVQLSPVH